MRIFYRKALIMCLMLATTLAVGCNNNDEPTPDVPDAPKELVEGTFSVVVDEVTEDSVTITITPSEEVDYFYACLASDTAKYLGGEDEVIVMDQLAQPNAEQMIFRGEQTLTFGGLIAHSHYRLLYFQYDSEGKKIFGELHRSDRITTLDGTEMFDISVSNITGLGAQVMVAPKAGVESYYYWIEDMSEYKTMFEDSDNVLMQNDFAYWQYFASLYEGTDWKEIMRQDIKTGAVEESTDNLYNVMMWDTEYMVYAYGLDNDGNVTTQMTKEVFKTLAPEKEELTFDIEITATEWDVAFNKFAVDAKITPSNPDSKYFVTITNMDWYEWYFTPNNTGRSDEEYIMYQILLNASRQSWEILEDLRFSGEITYKPYEIRSQYLNPNKRYGVFVFGLSEDGPTTGLKIYEFTTPDRPAQE